MGKTENARVPVFCPQLLIAALSFLSGPGEESRRLGEAGHPHPTPSRPLAFSARFHLPFASPPPLPLQTSSSSLFAEAPEGDPKEGRASPSAGKLCVSRRLPFVLSCERREGSETHSHLAPSPSLDIQGVRAHPQIHPEREKVPGNKAATPRPRQPRGAVVWAPPSVPPDSLPRAARPSRRGLGRCWGRAGGASEALLFPSSPHHLRGWLVLFSVAKSLGEKYAESAACVWKGQGRVAGLREFSPPVHQTRRLSDRGAATSLAALGTVIYLPPGGAGCWGGSSGSFFFFRVQIKGWKLSED